MAEQQRMVISVDGGKPQSCMAFSENAIGLNSAGGYGLFKCGGARDLCKRCAESCDNWICRCFA